jgi:hypothetical protein
MPAAAFDVTRGWRGPRLRDRAGTAPLARPVAAVVRVPDSRARIGGRQVRSVSRGDGRCEPGWLARDRLATRRREITFGRRSASKLTTAKNMNAIVRAGRAPSSRLALASDLTAPRRTGNAGRAGASKCVRLRDGLKRLGLRRGCSLRTTRHAASRWCIDAGGPMASRQLCRSEAPRSSLRSASGGHRSSRSPNRPAGRQSRTVTVRSSTSVIWASSCSRYRGRIRFVNITLSPTHSSAIARAERTV